jgi:hypothetical protein
MTKARMMTVNLEFQVNYKSRVLFTSDVSAEHYKIVSQMDEIHLRLDIMVELLYLITTEGNWAVKTGGSDFIILLMILHNNSIERSFSCKANSLLTS